ncbi:MAG: Probable transcription regulator Cj0571 [uncultured Sulfurovum sp.]|uniref:Probable transcription regulator Cj0571 n=1 Tax=uncultured Sulfurovum sp. TaxID=269237 RepID=A0A6S6S915_9BACT|nr:MAG: Probable transcription regulator Cj0571 [uncultured Sulfurovum sp.]
MAIDKKVKSIFTLMQLLVERKVLNANDKALAQSLGYTTKTLGRHLEDLSTLYPNIISVKKAQNKSYELLDVSYIFEKIMTNRDDLYWFFDLLERWDSNIFSDIDYAISKKDKEVFFYKNSPFEELENQKQKDIFTTLKNAIMKKQYVQINYVYDKPRVHEKAIPLKLIFMQYNWYIAIVDAKIGVRFLRVFFIENVQIDGQESYVKDVPDEILMAYYDFLKTFQNPMSRYDKPKNITKLKASPKVAKYFKPHMKRHFSSELFIENCADGSVIFSVEYTQSMEILPFVKRWLPEIKILSPKSLEDKLRDDLRTYLKF